MKIGLINTDSIVGMGIRFLSSYLKKHGHKTISLFMGKIEFYQNLSHESFTGINFYDLLEIFSECDIIGISSSSLSAYNTSFIISKLKILNKKIIWGGIHATLCPDFCLNHTDIVCIGEGEEAFLDLINRIEKDENIYNTPNFWFKTDSNIIKNNPRPLIQDLDSLPTPDYSFENQYIFDGKKIVPQNIKHFKCISYYSVCGCPHKCSYCSNAVLQKISSNNEPLKCISRKKSISKIINELEEIVKNFNPFIKIVFYDDNFFMRTLKEIQEFSEKYKERIKNPFMVGSSPEKINEKKLKLLIDAGLENIEIGIQSGSDRVNKEIFKRNTTKNQVIKTVNLINKYLKTNNFKLPIYHLIIENPYETNEELFETLKLLDSFPKPYILFVFSLRFLPATELYYKALQDSLITNPVDHLYMLNQTKYLDKVNIIKKSLITINDIIVLIGEDVITEEQYGYIKSDLIKDFLKNKDLIELVLEVMLTPDLRKFLDYTILDDDLKGRIYYIIRVIAFLRQKHHTIKEYKNIKYIEANFIDLEIVKNSTFKKIFMKPVL